MSEKELMDFQRPRMARWWVPDRVFFVPEIPDDGNGRESSDGAPGAVSRDTTSQAAAWRA